MGPSSTTTASDTATPSGTSTASRTTPPPSDPRLFTPAFAALSLAVLVFFIAGGILLPVTPLYTQEVLFGDRIAVGIVSGVFAAASLLMRPVAGRLSDVRGRRIALLIGAAISVAAMIGHLFAANLEVLLLMRVVLGASEALFFVAGLAAATDLAPERRRGEAISLVSLSLYLGIAVGPLLGEVMLDAWDYAAVWIATAALYVASVGLSWIVPETLRHDPAGTAEATPAALPATPADLAVEAGAPPTIERRHPLIHPRGIVPGLLALCGVWGMGPFFAFIPLLVEDLGIGSSGPYFGAFAIVVVVLRFAGAKLPDRLGTGVLGGTAFTATALGLVISGLAVANVIPVAEGLMIGTVVFACGVAFTLPVIMAMAVVGVRPDERGAVVGTAGLFVDSAFALSPAVLGVIATWLDYPPTFLVSAVITSVGAAYLLVRRPPSPATATATSAST